LEPASCCRALDKQSVYWKALPLRPGAYRVDIAIKDVNNPDHVGIYAQSINVPKFDDEKLATSSLILADSMYAVPSQTIGTGSFISATCMCAPGEPESATPVKFTRDQKLNFWMQVYNLGIDDKTKSNSATVTYEIRDTSTDKLLLGDARGVQGPERAQRSVDDGAQCGAGRVAAGQVQGDDSGK
jgi:hypothetical protein